MMSYSLPVTSAGANTLLLALRGLQHRTRQQRQELAERFLHHPNVILNDEEIEWLCDEINRLGRDKPSADLRRKGPAFCF